MIKFQCYTQNTQASISVVKIAFHEICDLPDVVDFEH